MTDTHCDEGTLLAIVDGLPVDARAREHASSCGKCTQVIAELETASTAFGALVRASDAGRSPGPEYDADFLAALHGRPRRHSRFAAPAIAAGVALMLLVPPARAWVANLAVRILSGGELVTVEAPQSVEPATASTVSISSASPLVRLEVSAPPRSVTLVEATEGAATVRLSVAPAVEVTALSDGFRLDAAAGVEITLDVPGTVERIELSVAGQRLFSGAVSRPLDGGWTLPLPE